MKRSLLQLWQMRVWMVGIALIPLLNSCLQTPSVDPSPISYVSIYHAVPDASGLDIALNGSKINSSSFNYGNYSGYVNFTAGTSNFKITATGSTTKLVDSTFTFKADGIYSVFFINRLSKMQALVVKDSSQAASVGNARVRLIHLSPDAPAVDVFASGSSSEVLFSGRTFKSSTEYLEVPAKTYTLNIRSSANPATVGTAQEIKIDEGKYYTLLVTGFASPPTGNVNNLTLKLISN